MCFSMEVSFGASAVLGTVGAISYQQAGKTKLRGLAMIPILFAFQQFSEGFVWLSQTNEYFVGLRGISTNVFIFFAWVIWPIYIPLVLWNLEYQKLRKQILFALIILGICAASVLLYVVIFSGVYSEVVDCSIAYNHGLDVNSVWIIGASYVMTTVVSNVITSVKWMWGLGALNLISISTQKFTTQNM